MSQCTFARMKTSESVVTGANWRYISHVFCIFPFLCLVAPSQPISAVLLEEHQVLDVGRQ